MAPARSVRNQYLGINAHLHSFWQAVGGWSRFHTNHISDLLRMLRPLLLPLGYDADIEHRPRAHKDTRHCKCRSDNQPTKSKYPY